MELLQLFSSYTNTTWFFLITIFLFSFINVNTNTSKSKKLPPGPWKLPIIGSMHHMLRKTLPRETLSKLAKKYGPIMHLQLGEVSTVVFSSPEVAKLVMKTHDLAFADRAGTLATDVITYNKSEISFAPYSDYLRQMKKICVLDLLSPKCVKSYLPIREHEVANMIDVIRKSAGTPINLSALFFTLSSSIVSTAVFGKNIHDQGKPVDLGPVAEVLLHLDGFNFADFFPSLKFLGSVSGMVARLKNAHNKIDTMLQEIIEKRREYYEALEKSGKGMKEKEDIMDTLLRLQKENEQEVQITDDNVKAIARDMFSAGSASPAIVIEWTMSELIRNPKVMEKVQSELRKSIDGNEDSEDDRASGLRYLNFVIKESLRLHPPAPLLIPRECREACEINGYHIPKKTRVIVNACGIGRDPEVWEDAEKFIPERFEKNMFEFNGTNFEYIPFGSGRRICPAITFGVAIVEIALTQLLYHFNWKLPNNAKGEMINMEETSGLAAKRKIPLQLVAIPR